MECDPFYRLCNQARSQSFIGHCPAPWYTFRVYPGLNILVGTVFILLLAIVPGEARSAGRIDNAVFSSFTGHIARQMGLDKQAFAQASTCLSWFYKASKKPPPPAFQGINWSPTAAPSLEEDCPRFYPGGMDAAREDFARTQTLLSVCLTVYEFALVADQDDNQSYSTIELQDLFQSLSLAYDTADSPRASIDTLTDRFDNWYRARTLDQVMQGMSTLYERGYRVTPDDRAELDRVMK